MISKLYTGFLKSKNAFFVCYLVFSQTLPIVAPPPPAALPALHIPISHPPAATIEEYE